MRLTTQDLLYFARKKKGARSRRAWVLAITAHVLLFFLIQHWHPEILTPAKPEAPRFEVVSLPKKRTQKNRNLLLSQDQTHVTEKPRDDARYDSDKNRIVEKEMRARSSDVIPKPGSSGKNSQAGRPLQKFGISLHSLNQPVGQARETSQGENGADQSLFDKRIPEGAAINLLNTAESRFYSFYSRIYTSIGPVWQSSVRSATQRIRPPEGEYLTRSEVIMNEYGEIKNVIITQSSGLPEFDQVVLASWSKMPRFPNPPRALFEKDGYIHMGWSFMVAIDQGFGTQYAPPSREY